MPRTLMTAVLFLIVGVGLTAWWIHTHSTAPPGPGQVRYPAVQRPGALHLPAVYASDPCIACHQRTTPAIVVQWARGKHAAARLTCVACHQVSKDHPLAVWHEGAYIMATTQPVDERYPVGSAGSSGSPGSSGSSGSRATAVVTPAKCAECHAAEVQQFLSSRHALPAWAALSGTDDFKGNKVLLAQYEAIPEIRRHPTGHALPQRNALYDIEGSRVTPVACERCHSIGRPWLADNSAGRCSACHSRHEFSLAQVRKPETCNNCHIGPDHPQFEIYMESKHGIQYATRGETWNWDQAPGRLSTSDFPAPTCALCHISGFGPTPTSHAVGQRLSLFLHEAISLQRPIVGADGTIEYEVKSPPAKHPNRLRMQGVCTQCHTEQFVLGEYAKYDSLLGQTNQWVSQANDIMADLYDLKLASPKPFSEKIHFTAFELWHHWGRTAKFGAYMQGADYSQWHGVYPLLGNLVELGERASALKATTQPERTRGGHP